MFTHLFSFLLSWNEISFLSFWQGWVHPRMKFHPGENVETVRDTSSPRRGCLYVKFHPGMELLPWWNDDEVSMMKCLLLPYTFLPEWNFISGWTRPCQKDRDEVSSQNDNRNKNMSEHFSPRWNFTTRMFLHNFWCIYLIFFPALICLNIKKVRRNIW